MVWHMWQYAAYLVVAALLGLFVGWLIWARRTQVELASFNDRAEEMRQELMAHRQETAANADELGRLRHLAAQGAVGELVSVGESTSAGDASEDQTHNEGTGSEPESN